MMKGDGTGEDGVGLIPYQKVEKQERTNKSQPNARQQPQQAPQRQQPKLEMLQVSR